MTIFDWIEAELKPRTCDSTEFFYNEMESQSDYALPILYQPFDADNPGHWLDRGFMFDFLYSIEGEGKKLLDFGPGDGWPSLIIAPFAEEVIGVDGSPKRVEVCAQNAARLGIANTRFLYQPPGKPLPFPDNSFDGAMAASSIEQTPDPRATLAELFRVLRPGGRLRIYHEALGIYRNGGEQEADLVAIDERMSWLTIYDRHIDDEFVHMYRLRINLPLEQANLIFLKGEQQALWKMLNISTLEKIHGKITESKICKLTHPSGKTLRRWMEEIGFSQVIPTHSGGWFAYQYFKLLPEQDRPADLQSVDKLLGPLVKVVARLAAPWELPGGRNPMLTALKPGKV